MDYKTFTELQLAYAQAVAVGKDKQRIRTLFELLCAAILSK